MQHGQEELVCLLVIVDGRGARSHSSLVDVLAELEAQDVKLKSTEKFRTAKSALQGRLWSRGVE